MEKEKMLKHLDQAIEKQVPDVWDEIQNKVHRIEKLGYKGDMVMQNNDTAHNKKRRLYKRLSIVAAICLITVSTLTFTPALAAIQEALDKIFSSKHIDDTGLKMAINEGRGQTVNQTYYDKKHDITVHFESVLTDDKETKLLLTYQSKKTNLQHYYVDIFEGKSSIKLIVGDGQKKRLHTVGWGSRYYDAKENKVFEAESFDSIKEYEGQNIRLEIENLTIYDDQKTGEVKTKWPLEFKLGKSAISTRETVNVDKEFTFENQNYRIKQVEFSAMETRVVVTGSDTKLIIENGEKFHVLSKLEHQFLHARKFNKKYGYIVDNKKSGVFLRSAGKRADPIFSKGEVQGADDEYIMFFAPVKDRQNCVLEVGEDIKIPLAK
ncbi:DUF4179 domain-containing protein [Neobacillus niacini]|uniref:DUF4179 domain-containing protein n=1 Tax=Neobacillus niacini TaxID=86668 RepID=UPI00286263C1|nr:DUF4179 domain-containing protein [Neobacillus niacini]MDR6997791.1 hypothetical protein [Neobacillus niacini]